MTNYHQSFKTIVLSNFQQDCNKTGISLHWKDCLLLRYNSRLVSFSLEVREGVEFILYFQVRFFPSSICKVYFQQNSVITSVTVPTKTKLVISVRLSLFSSSCKICYVEPTDKHLNIVVQEKHLFFTSLRILYFHRRAIHFKKVNLVHLVWIKQT